MSMKCPHCEEEINSAIRTGDRRYSCGECNMVIAYDDLEPHLDELEVMDKRTPDEDESSGDSSGNSGGAPSDSNEPSGDGGSFNPDQGGNQSPDTPQGASTGLNEREIIYEQGVKGLKRIKKERLKNWLANTEGAGAQTEQRILMVFDRNESVHTNPNVLYNFLDDELSASASYINTMVRDIFAPEEEHEDILRNNGYTPWYAKGPGGGSNMNNSRGGPGNMNQQSSGFSAQQPGPPQGQGAQQHNQQQQSQQSSGEQPMTKREAEMMMSKAMDQADTQQERRALVEGLSDATDEAVREMASNVGGLAGTLQRVVDEALVEYARQNPEWVVENMGMLQKILGATEDMDGSSGGAPDESQHDAKVDDALASIGGQGNSNSGKSEVNNKQQQRNEPTRQTRDSGGANRHKQSRGGQSKQQQSQGGRSEEVVEEQNPDLSEDHFDDSGFEPQPEEGNPMKAGPNDGGGLSSFSSEGESEEPDEPEPGIEEENSEEEDEEEDQDIEDASFDEIFGDM